MDDVPGWSFKMSEESNSHYCVRGAGPRGMSVERHGSDPEELDREARADARELNSRLGLAS